MGRESRDGRRVNRVLHVIRTLDPATGGTATVVQNLVQHAPVPQTVVTLDRATVPWVQPAGGAIVPFGPARRSYGWSPELRQYLSQQADRFSAIVVHGLWEYLGVAVRLAAMAAKVPYFVFPHGMLDPWFAKAYPFKHLKKQLYWRLAEHRVLRDARAVLFTAEEERRLARDSFRPYECCERIVPCGVPAPPGNAAEFRESFLAENPTLRRRRIVLFLGRIHPKKGIEHLIEAFASAPNDCALVVAGPCSDSRYLSRLQELAARLIPPPSVVWPGMLTGDRKWGAFFASDIFVLPSHQENFGMAVAESLACGLPVLISNRVNIWREIETDRAGFVDNDDTDGTRRMLERWFSLRPQEREAMRQAARSCFSSRYEINQAARAFLEQIDLTESNELQGRRA